MSHKLNHLIEAEMQQLDMLVEPRRSLITRSLDDSPKLEDLDALSAFLHSAYTAMERIMVHIAKIERVYEEVRTKSFMWHIELLNALAIPTGNRHVVISGKLHTLLKEYLGFRHVFRHAYLHELQWSKMRPLVENIENVIRLFKAEINEYLQKHT